MKLTICLLTLLLLPIHTEAKQKGAREEGRFLTSINPFVCKQVQEIGSTARGPYIQMGNGTDKDMTMVTFKFTNRDRGLHALTAAATSLNSQGRIVFCLSKRDLKTDAKEFALTDDTSFSAMTGDPR